MVIDTSAILAVIKDEPAAESVLGAIGANHQRLMSAATYVELFLVLDNAGDPAAVGRVEELLNFIRVEIVDVTADQAAVARQAHRDFGRGRHPARLNFGDCFSSALAKVSHDTLLYVGDGFGRTDVRSAL